MFGLSFFEVLFILVIALLVFGPEKLPEFAKALGKVTGELKKNTDALRKEFYNSVYPPASQIRNDFRELKTSPIKKIHETLDAMDHDYHSSDHDHHSSDHDHHSSDHDHHSSYSEDSKEASDSKREEHAKDEKPTGNTQESTDSEDQTKK